MRHDAEVMIKSPSDWDLWYLRVAKIYGEGSKDPSSKVGALIVLNKRLRAAGYNGFNAGTYDDPRYYQDRTKKYELTKHAEIAALEEYQYINQDGVMYIYPYLPCLNCAKAIIESGKINKVVCTNYTPERWRENCDEAQKLLQDAGITVLRYDIIHI